MKDHPRGFFDLQLFATKPTLLTELTMDELSLVVGDKYAPRNADARFLGVKSGPADGDAKPRRKNFLQTLVEKAWPLNEGIADNIDGDGDGTEDYNQILNIFSNAYWDLSAAYGIGSDDARTQALVTVVDVALANIDSVRSGGDGMVRKATAKAGRKLSAATKEKIRAIGETVKSSYAEIDALLTEDEAAEKAGVVPPAAAIVPDPAASVAPVASKVTPAAAPAPAAEPVIAQPETVAASSEKSGIDLTAFESMMSRVVGEQMAPLSSRVTELGTRMDTQKAEAEKRFETLTTEVKTASSKAAAVVDVNTALVGNATKASVPGGLPSINPETGESMQHPALAATAKAGETGTPMHTLSPLGASIAAQLRQKE